VVVVVVVVVGVRPRCAKREKDGFFLPVKRQG
jgi:hypothetical protein